MGGCDGSTESESKVSRGRNRRKHASFPIFFGIGNPYRNISLAFLRADNSRHVHKIHYSLLTCDEFLQQLEWII